MAENKKEAQTNGAENNKSEHSAAENQLPPLVVNAQYIKDLSFEHPDPVNTFKGHAQQPEISVSIDVEGNLLEERTFEVVLSISAQAHYGEKKAFVIELHYGGIFTLGEVIPDEAIHPVLMIECPRILFPYARAVISSVTGEGGFPPLSLNPIDFAGLYQQQMQAQQEHETSKAPTN